MTIDRQIQGPAGGRAVTAYQNESVQAARYASPHSLVAMLIDGAVERVVQARGAMERGLIARKGERIGRAITIVDSLRASLDVEAGGDIAVNLAALYDYLIRRLLHANVHNDVLALDEAVRLLKEIKAGWDGIADAAEPATAVR
ncbi:MAG: flagellar export chaperone FliS [Pseudomonadales bacterium]